MKACRVHHFGPPDVISFEDVAQPHPSEGEVLVRVKAAGVGPWDAWIRAVRLSDVEAASVPVVAVTAQQALFEQAKLVAGQRVLIHGAAGNVGAYAVQMARQAGLRVIGTADARDVEAVHSLGAQEVID